MILYPVMMSEEERASPRIETMNTVLKSRFAYFLSTVFLYTQRA